MSDPETFFEAGITLTKNIVKDIMKVIKFLESKEILFKGSARNITTQEGRFLNVFRPLITASLPLTKNILIPLAKSVFVSLRLTAAASATNAVIQKKISGSGTTT